MENFDDLILFENENSTIDFKAKIYHKSQHHSLIKDLLSLANSHVIGDKYIVMGVKLLPNGKRELLGISENEIPDVATYEQLIEENIEPSISIDLIPHNLESNMFLVLKILNPTDRPYQAKKNFGKHIKKGDSFIRKGTHQTPITRSDLDQIYLEKQKSSHFSGKIKVWFSASNQSKSTIFYKRTIHLPSNIQAERIRRILASREADIKGSLLKHLPTNPFSPGPYEEWSNQELHKALANIKKTYKDHDNFTILEEYANKFNITLLNTGNQYIENCIVEVFIPIIKGIPVAEKLYRKPRNRKPLDLISESREPLAPDHEALSYLEYEIEGNFYKYQIELGDLKHNISQEVFACPIRATVFEWVKVKLFDILIKIHGKNLSKPLQYSLQVNIEAELND